jgi:hypothetical protein
LLGPAALASLIALLVAIATGGPIAGAIAGFAFGSVFIISAVVVLLLFKVWATESPLYQLLMGIGTYLVSMVFVVLLWSIFGQSQIM